MTPVPDPTSSAADRDFPGPQESALPVSAGRSGFRLLLVFLALLTISGGVWAGLRFWREARSEQFEAACRSARQDRDWKRLRDVADQWTSWDPSESKGWWAAAEAAQEQDEFEEMAACLGKIPETDPNIAFALAEKANLEWAALNRPVEALATSEKVIKIDPRLVETHSRIISFYAMNQLRIPMLKAIRSAISAGAEPKEVYTYLIMADVLSFTNGSELNERWMRAAPEEPRFKIGLAVNTAMRLVMNQETSPTAEIIDLNNQAKNQIALFLKEFPHDPVILTFLMHQAYRAGDLPRMEELLAMVDDAAGQDHMIWVYRAWYHTQTNELKEAEEAIAEALRLHPMSPLAHHEYANLLRLQQRPEVEREQRLAAYGRDLRSQVLLLPTAVDLTTVLLVQIQSYAEACGDSQVAAAINLRL